MSHHRFSTPEASQALGIPVHVITYWLGQIPYPAEQDAQGQWRLTPEAMGVLQAVKGLKERNASMEEIRKHVRALQEAMPVRTVPGAVTFVAPEAAQAPDDRAWGIPPEGGAAPAPSRPAPPVAAPRPRGPVKPAASAQPAPRSAAPPLAAPGAPAAASASTPGPVAASPAAGPTSAAAPGPTQAALSPSHASQAHAQGHAVVAAAADVVANPMAANSGTAPGGDALASITVMAQRYAQAAHQIGRLEAENEHLKATLARASRDADDSRCRIAELEAAANKPKPRSRWWAWLAMGALL